MGKERCHSLITREAVAGFRTLPDKTLGSDSKFVTKPTFSKGKVGRGSGTANRLTAKGGFRFAKICSRIEILKIPNFDGKTGKLRVTENT